jgi:hypothetical protein
VKISGAPVKEYVPEVRVVGVAETSDEYGAVVRTSLSRRIGATR